MRVPAPTIDGVGLAPEHVSVGAGLLRGDPLRGAVSGRHRSVESHGVLQGDEGGTGLAMVEVAGVERPCGRVVDEVYLDSGAEEPAMPARQPGRRDRPCRSRPLPPPRRRAGRHRVGCARCEHRLQGDVDGGPAWIGDTFQGRHLGVGAARAQVCSLTQDLSGG